MARDGVRLHFYAAPAFWLALAGFAVGDLPVPGQSRNGRARAASCSRWPIRILENKYWFDDLWIKGFAGGGLGLGKFCPASATPA